MDFSEEEKKQFDLWKSSQKNITKIEVQADKVEPLPKKEKKPRTEKQIEATKRMREALLSRRKDHNEKKTEHSDLYKQKMQEAQEKADVIRELNPDVKVVVKSRVGRPKGRKNLPTDPTPYQSDAEDEDEIEPPKNRTLKPKQSQLVVHQPRMSSLEMYMRKLNGY
jgi:hypothetical protein